MTNALILYYSSYGHIEAMANAQAEGARRVAHANVVIKRVPELVSEATASAYGYKLNQVAPMATPEELEHYDAIIFGTPTRFGNMAAPMRHFLDQTGPLWGRSALVGKVGSVFCSTASQHGGQETTITSFHLTLLHHGMVVVGLPYTCKHLSGMHEISGGGPYGASCVAGTGPTGRMPTHVELDICRYQGEHVTRIASQLVAGSKAGAQHHR